MVNRMVERAVSQSSKVYDNKSWDLVDAAKDNDKKPLPKRMKKRYLPKWKAWTRSNAKIMWMAKPKNEQPIQTEIQTLNKSARRALHHREHA